MIKIICNKTLYSDQKLILLSNFQVCFDKLKDKTGVFVCEQTKPDAPANDPETHPQVLITQPNVEEQVDLIYKISIIPMYRNKAIKLLSKIEKIPTSSL